MHMQVIKKLAVISFAFEQFWDCFLISDFCHIRYYILSNPSKNCIQVYNIFYFKRDRLSLYSAWGFYVIMYIYCILIYYNMYAPCTSHRSLHGVEFIVDLANHAGTTPGDFPKYSILALRIEIKFN